MLSTNLINSRITIDFIIIVTAAVINDDGEELGLFLSFMR